MKEVVLENSHLVALVDDDDYANVANIKWYLSKNGYVYGYFGFDRKQYLHRFLLGLPPRRPFVDHKNNTRLDCRRSNLRLCTNQQNTFNQSKRVGLMTSRFKGVSWEKRVKKWRATIVLNGKQVHIGTFGNEEEAARAYDKKAVELFGEFARTNFKVAA